jgi:precorrin-6A synthase
VRTLLLIGIGAGDPSQVTVQAVEAMRRAEVFLVLDKDSPADELGALREQICARYLPDGGYRVRHAPDPARDRRSPRYAEAVSDWHEQRAAVYEELLVQELPEDGVAGVLVWGDPALYDSTLRVVDRLRRRGVVEVDVEVIPGISSVQALAAAHQVLLNRVGGPILVTTGRRLRDGWPAGVDDLVVMLDSHCVFTEIAATDADVEIYWGAYLGTPDELLVAGPLREVADQIVRTRAAARERKGWVMDTYLLRRVADHPDQTGPTGQTGQQRPADPVSDG